MEDLRKILLETFNNGNQQTKQAITLLCLVIDIEHVKTILDDLQENQKKFSIVLKQHQESIQKLENKSL